MDSPLLARKLATKDAHARARPQAEMTLRGVLENLLMTCFNIWSIHQVEWKKTRKRTCHICHIQFMASHWFPRISPWTLNHLLEKQNFDPFISRPCRRFDMKPQNNKNTWSFALPFSLQVVPFSYGKSPCLMGTIIYNGPFSIAMLPQGNPYPSRTSSGPRPQYIAAAKDQFPDLVAGCGVFLEPPNTCRKVWVTYQTHIKHLDMTRLLDHLGKHVYPLVNVYIAMENHHV